MRPIEVSLTSIPECDLAALARWCANEGQQHSADFCDWLLANVAAEGGRRYDGGKEPAAAYWHLPDFWTNRQVAEALECVTCLSFARGVSEDTGKLLDKLTIHVAAMAANRLRETIPARLPPDPSRN